MPLFSRKQRPQVRDNMSLAELLHEARVTDDAVYAKACLDRAEILAPDSLEAQRALLMHGRLHERGRDPGDFSVIKCYLLHGFEHPEEYSEEALRRQAQELFCDPRLKACLALSPDPEGFLKDYLAELSQQYMHLFVAGDSSHAPRLFGFSHRSSLPRYLAMPASDIIRNMLSSPFLDAEQQRLLARSFYEAFSRQMEGRTTELDRQLGPQLCQALA